MLSIYWLCFIVGGIFVAFAALAGLDGADFDQDFDSDVAIIENGDRTEEERAKNSLRHRLLSLPFFSLRFWTFGSCFFGLTGIVLSQLGSSLPQWVTVAIAIAVGVFCGTAMVWVLHTLQQRKADSLVRPKDLVGLSAKVQIPFDRESKGRVSVNVKGAVVDFVAFTDDTKGFEKGEKVFVVGMKNHRLWVVSEESTQLTVDR